MPGPGRFQNFMGYLRSHRRVFEKYADLKILSGFLASAVFLWIFGGITEEVLEQDTVVDDLLMDLMGQIRTPLLTSVMIFITNMGDPVVIWAGTIVFICFLLYFKKREQAIFVTWTIVGGAVLNQVLKFSIHRSRPSGTSLVEAWGWSYPSGHAMMSVLFYLSLGFFLMRRTRQPAGKAAVIIIFTAIPVMIALSRIYLQVHYFSDAAAGLFGGLFWFAVCVTTLLFFRKRSDLKSGD